jgi:hypothetical protein
VRGIKATLRALATSDSEDADVFCYLGIQLADADTAAVHAYGKIFFGSKVDALD